MINILYEYLCVKVSNGPKPVEYKIHPKLTTAIHVYALAFYTSGIPPTILYAITPVILLYF